jgi:glyoxylase-like metal-dependent hydrolase (beta-lactamase superfamily II)
MADYMVSLELLLERDDEIYWPTHGPCIDEPKAHVRAYIAHRLEREQQIVNCIEGGTFKIREMVPLMYKDTPEFMYPAAARSVLAAMENLVKRGTVIGSSGVTMDSDYSLA